MWVAIFYVYEGESMSKKTLLFMSSSCQAKEREYFRKGVRLSMMLKNRFDVCISHIESLEELMNKRGSAI